MRLKGKVAVIAGAGAGVGRAAAVLFAEQGAKVAIIARSKDVLDETASMVEAREGKVISIVADLTQNDQIEKAFNQVAEKFGTIDIIHCNTGSYSTSSAKSITESSWEDMFESNLKSSFLIVRAGIPHLVKNGSGSIILTAAVFGSFLATKNMAHYNSSKAGVVALTKSLALELASARIRVNCVCPGQITHDLHTKGKAEIKTNPELLRGGIPEDVAFAVLYLASDESSWVTGSTLVIDGGLSVGVDPRKS